VSIANPSPLQREEFLLTRAGDVEEREVHKDEIGQQRLFKLAFLNARLGADGYPWSS
jgi:hypothetical protein